GARAMCIVDCRPKGRQLMFIMADTSLWMSWRKMINMNALITVARNSKCLAPKIPRLALILLVIELSAVVSAPRPARAMAFPQDLTHLQEFRDGLAAHSSGWANRMADVTVAYMPAIVSSIRSNTD